MLSYKFHFIKPIKNLLLLCAPFGLYRYNYLPFGFTASPGIFQSFITKTRTHIPNLLINQDDVLIMSKDYASHIGTLRQVQSTLRNTGVKINGKKSQFMCDRVGYLGHIFDSHGVHPNPIKINSIIDAPAPKNIKQVQAFLGLCNNYSMFIRS